MPDLKLLLDKAREWNPACTALATVVSTWGSAPRPRGSHMLLHGDGRFEGSVSGGCVESDVMSTAEAVIASGKFVLRRYGVASDVAWEVGLPCGGEIEVLIQPIGVHGFPLAAFDAILHAREQGETLAISTDLATGMSTVGEMRDRFVNHYRPPRRLLIVGAVQIAQSLAAICRELDIQVTIIDPRARFLTAERFPNVELDDSWPDDAVRDRHPDRSTAIVTLSHDPKIDDPALLAALEFSTGYIGALGSRKNHVARLDRLREAGADERSLLRIEGPAGLDIGAVGPAEIAVSIVGAMTKSFNDSR